MARLNPTAEEKKQDAAALEKYAGARRVATYDAETRAARHVHVPAAGKHRLLNHFYAFGFFGDPDQRSFYRRFIRDNMRYIDDIQCAGARLVDAVRATSRTLGQNGDFYALHIRRGDFQFKEVKISASKIVENLGGHRVIPAGALVYLATDDPDGVCKNCMVNRKPCPVGPAAACVAGCQVDPSWDAFRRNGWVVTTMKNYTVWIPPTGLGGPHQTSELSISVKSKSIRLIFGRIDCSRQVLEARQKASRRIRSH